MKVNFYDLKEEIKVLKYAIVLARYQGKWIFVRHKDRTTWEISAGHIEVNETYEEAGKRELWEETGATEFKLKPICYYSVVKEGIETFGVLSFAEVETLGELPEYEIVEVLLTDKMPENLTYPEIQPILFERVIDELK